jgi:hypothetical protein
VTWGYQRVSILLRWLTTSERNCLGPRKPRGLHVHVGNQTKRLIEKKIIRVRCPRKGRSQGNEVKVLPEHTKANVFFLNQLLYASGIEPHVAILRHTGLRITYACHGEVYSEVLSDGRGPSLCDVVWGATVVSNAIYLHYLLTLKGGIERK